MINGLGLGMNSMGRLAFDAKILVAEDNTDTRRLLEITLKSRLPDYLKEDEPVEVVTAADGEEAIKQIEESGFDLVLTDCKMPKKGGFEVIEEAVRQGIPVIMVSGERPQKFKTGP